MPLCSFASPVRVFFIIQSKSQDSLDHRYTKDASRNGEIRFSELSSKSSKDRLQPDSCSCHGSKEDLSDAHESPNPKSETELLTSPHITIIKQHHSNHDPHGHLEYHDHHEVDYSIHLLNIVIIYSGVELGGSGGICPSSYSQQILTLVSKYG